MREEGGWRRRRRLLISSLYREHASFDLRPQKRIKQQSYIGMQNTMLLTNINIAHSSRLFSVFNWWRCSLSPTRTQDADQVERLNESGELRQMLKPYKVSRPVRWCFMRRNDHTTSRVLYTPFDYYALTLYIPHTHIFTVHRHVIHLPSVRRLSAAALSVVQGLQEVGASQSLHHRVRGAQVHELRRSRPGQVLQLLSERWRDRTSDKPTTLSLYKLMKVFIFYIILFFLFF